MSEQLTELPAVARNVNLPCKKCGVDRYFVVLAHSTPTSAKVQCEVCGAKQTFKLAKPKAAKKPAKAKSKSASKSGSKSKSTRPPTAAESAALFLELREKIGIEKLHPYNMRTKYTLATAIQHPKFGIGFVTFASPEKIEVAFEEGGRALVHNRVS